MGQVEDERRDGSGSGSGSDGAHSQSLERGLAILSAFDRSRPVLGVSELARTVGLSRSTAHRYVATLASLGYLQQDPETRRYRLGPRVLDLGFSAISSMELRELSSTHLRRLSEETGRTANMAILDGTDIVYIERVRSRNADAEIDLDLHVGSRLPAYCTSMGKVLLAFLPTRDRNALVDRMELVPRGPNALVDAGALVRELDLVRERGYASADQELAYGIRSLAAPIRERAGGVVAAINLSVHRSTTTLGSLASTLVPPLLRTAAEISAQVGFRDPHL